MGKESSSKEIKEASSKKRRKELSTSETPQKIQVSNHFTSDEYKVVIKNEETEAAVRSGDEDLVLFCSVCDQFRKYMVEIAALLNANTQQTADQCVEKRQLACLLFAALKKLNRMEKFRMLQSREKLHKTRHQADSFHLQLQNLLYELLHLKKEVAKCLIFNSKDDDIDLVPVEEFYREAPASISRPEITKENPHQLKLARLEWELHQRKESVAEYTQLKMKKEMVATDIKLRKAQLRNLYPMLKDILVASAPAQELLGLNSGPSAAMLKTASLLPHPLFFLYLQTEALREAGDKSLSVKIQGEEEDYLALEQTMAELAVRTEAPDDSDSDTQEDVVAKRHGHRKKSRADKLEERKKLLLMAHPITLLIDIKMKGTPASISLEFVYYVKLHVVTVKPTLRISSEANLSSTSCSSKLVTSENILVELFPEDFGDCSPNLANSHQLRQVGIGSFDAAQLGLVYAWAQKVAGLDFAGSSGGGEAAVPANMKCSECNLPVVVKAIKKRLLARVSLCQQLQTLETKVIPNFPELRKCFPLKLIVELTQWSSLSWLGYQALGFTHVVVNKGFVSERDTFYKGTLVRSNARLTVAVAIKNSYPVQVPLFTLQAAYGNNTTQAENNDSIGDIEREVNVYYDELLQKTPSHNILTAQILRLMTCFDILLEASTNQDFPRDKIFFQPNRGAKRAWPFKGIDKGDGVFHFTQR